MKEINKHNKNTYDSYTDFTSKYKNDFRAGGHSRLAWRMRRSLLLFMTQFINLGNVNMLDIGCNNGYVGRELCNMLGGRNMETNIDGIDFVEEATEIAKTVFNYRATYNVDITDQEITLSALGKEKYQFVFCCEVFLYINPDDYGRFFQSINNHLDEGGYLLLVLPNIKSIYHRANKLVAPGGFAQYYKYDYRLSKVLSLMNQYGFNVNKAYGAELFTRMKLNLHSDSLLKNLFSFELALLGVKQ